MTAVLVDDGPLHRRSIDGNLFYVHPITDEKFVSVTTVNDFIEKEFLSNRWKPEQAALAAFAELPRVVAASRIKACGRTYNRCEHDWRVRCVDCACGDCKPCMIKWLTNRHYAESARRSDEGTGLHRFIKNWVLSGGKRDEVLPAVEPYVAQFLVFVEDFGITPESFEMTEATILNRASRWGDIAGFGGTLDAHIRFDATATPKAKKLCAKFGKRQPLVTLDWKSREKDKAAFYPENAKQLAPYCRGEVILFRDGREEPLPPTDGGVVVQIRPDGYGWRRAQTDDVTYAAFLATMHAALWEITYGEQATQVKTFPDLDIPDMPAPEPKKRAPRKAAAPRANRITAPAAAAQAPATPAAGVTAERTVAERLGIAVSAGASHPDSPYGDEIPF